jgi:NDP-sugar pyrophosphorylase family protein
MKKIKPTLVVLAAGLGSRYGSLKQIDRIGPSGERIIDYSVYDAVKAGFGKIVYIIRKSFKDEFIKVILNDLPPEIETELVCQELDAIPPGISYSKERVKPWGTGHALMVASSVIDKPFAVVNADDFYGAEAFEIVADFLTSDKPENEYGLVGYKMKNTLSEYGSVSRGICETDKDNYLTSIVERTEIKISNGEILFKDENEQWQKLTGNETVSMNMFAFNTSVFDAFEKYFKEFINENKENFKAEFYMPMVVDKLIKTGQAKVKVLECAANWFGLTYPEDKPIARKKIKKLVEEGKYPSELWT